MNRILLFESPLGTDACAKRVVRAFRAVGGEINDFDPQKRSLTGRISTGNRNADVDVSWSEVGSVTTVRVEADAFEMGPFASESAVARFEAAFNGLDKPGFVPDAVGVADFYYWIMAGVVVLGPFVAMVVYLLLNRPK